MSAEVVIAGEKVSIGWTVETQRALRIRASKAGLEPDKLLADFAKPRKAEYAVTAMLWLLLPADTYRKYPTPEDLFGAIEDKDAPVAFGAVIEVLSQLDASAEKKSTGVIMHLLASNLASASKSGTTSTQTKRKNSSKRGKTSSPVKTTGLRSSASSRLQPKARKQKAEAN